MISQCEQIWQKFKSFAIFGVFCICQKLEHSLAFFLLAHFHGCKWPIIEQIIQQITA